MDDFLLNELPHGRHSLPYPKACVTNLEGTVGVYVDCLLASYVLNGIHSIAETGTDSCGIAWLLATSGRKKDDACDV